MDEKQLVLQAQEGDMQAFEELMERYQKKVYNIALRMLKSEQDALDVSQEVFLRLYHALPSFKGDSAFSTWIYRITLNMSIDFNRKQKKRADQVSLSLYDSEGEEYHLPLADYRSDPQQVLSDREAIRAYQRALDRLPGDQRQAVMLRDVTGLSYQEIAEVMDCNMGTIKSKINRGRERLKALFRY